ncbi:hypothetical protein B0H16DRAFT_1809240 [Mycena metata]|uniref:Uncharacterized protein n=1 Tax=Mycena metata TaxID=1033252 RepID=A0AAD7H851_9AGAR|nr:hypothetical protein B0H16DRAFT_1809240 [Mycena metata]
MTLTTAHILLRRPWSSSANAHHYSSPTPTRAVRPPSVNVVNLGDQHPPFLNSASRRRSSTTPPFPPEVQANTHLPLTPPLTPTPTPTLSAKTPSAKMMSGQQTLALRLAKLKTSHFKASAFLDLAAELSGDDDDSGDDQNEDEKTRPDKEFLDDKPVHDVPAVSSFRPVADDSDDDGDELRAITQHYEDAAARELAVPQYACQQRLFIVSAREVLQVKDSKFKQKKVKADFTDLTHRLIFPTREHTEPFRLAESRDFHHSLAKATFVGLCPALAPGDRVVVVSGEFQHKTGQLYLWSLREVLRDSKQVRIARIAEFKNGRDKLGRFDVEVCHLKRLKQHILDVFCSIQMHDRVCVVSGVLHRGLSGRVTDLSDGLVGATNGELEFTVDVCHVARDLRCGDVVHVIRGQFTGSVGLIVHIGLGGSLEIWDAERSENSNTENLSDEVQAQLLPVRARNVELVDYQMAVYSALYTWTSEVGAWVPPETAPTEPDDPERERLRQERRVQEQKLNKYNELRAPYDEEKTRKEFQDRHRFPWEGDLEDEDDVADDVDPDEDVNTLSAEEAEFRADYFSKLRTKIGVWYNSEFKTDLPTKRKKNLPFTKLFNKRELKPPAPVKMRTLHFYSRNFYTERVKPRVATRCQVLWRLPNPPKMITVRTMVTKEAWWAETQEFREEVELALAKEYETARKAYEMAVSGETPTTPEEFSVALNNAGYYIQPFADAIHDRFGMNVVVMLCGPIPDHGGRIEVRSVHSGTTNGLVPRIWSDFDRGGFDIAQRSFVDFTHHCFTDEECRSRALSGNVGAEGDDEGASALGPDDAHPSGNEDKEDAAPIDPAHPSTNTPTPPTPGSDLAVQGVRAPVDPVPTFTFPDTQAPTFTFPNPQAPTFTFPDTQASTFLDTQASSVLDTQTPTLTEEEYATLIAQAGGEGQWVNEGKFDVGSSGGASSESLFDPAAYMENGWLVGSKEDGGGSGPSDGLRFGHLLELPPLLGPDISGGGGELAGSNTGAGGVDAAVLTAADPKVADAPPVVDVDAAGGKGKERPKPKPMYCRALAKSVEEAVLERPEVNPDAEGPLNAEGAKKQVAKDVTVTAAEEKDGEEEVEGGGNDGEGGVWEEEDMTAWPEELKYAYAGFERGQVWGGEVWKVCVDVLIAVERAQGFRAKGWLSAPTSEHPVEIPDFMRYAHRWDKPLALSSEIGPTANEGSMADRWWNWWTTVQPASRMQAGGKLKLAERVPVVEWEDLGKMSGRNGVLLYVGALLWWGELAVDDVVNALRLAAESTTSAANKSADAKPTADRGKGHKAAKPTASKTKAAKPKTVPVKAKAIAPKVATQTSASGKRGSKRKQPDVPGEKENEPAK